MKREEGEEAVMVQSRIARNAPERRLKRAPNKSPLPTLPLASCKTSPVVSAFAQFAILLTALRQKERPASAVRAALVRRRKSILDGTFTPGYVPGNAKKP